MLKRHGKVFILLVLFFGVPLRLGLGDTLSSYKNQMPAGPVADAVNTGIEALRQHDFDKAEASFRQALRIDPSEPHALILMADVAILRGKPAEALPYLRTAVRKNPQSAAAEEAMGRYFALQKDYVAAETALQKSVSLDPKWIEAELSLGDFYFTRGKFAQSVAAYRTAVRNDPNNGIAHFSLGMALQGTGDIGSAEAEFRNASRVTPQAAGPHIALADLLAQAGNEDAAIAEYETASKLAPHNGAPYAGIGMVQQHKGRMDLAEQFYRKALEIQPNQPMALNALARMELQDAHRLDEALSLAQRAVQTAPNVGQFTDTLGWVYHAKGNNQDAIVALKKAVVSSPQDPEIHYHLAVAYQDSGKLPDAFAEINRSLSFEKDFPEIADARKRHDDLTKRLHR